MKKEVFKEEDLTLDMVRSLIYMVRGRKVMLDEDLAMLYGVETKVLNQAVKRNVERFPEDFMFQLTKNEELNLKSQIVTSSYGGRRKSIRVFTEQGIAMLSSVLNSSRAIQINIQIIRVFTKLRGMINAYKELREKVEEMERNNETNFSEIFKILRSITKTEEKSDAKIGFNTEASKK